VSESPKSFILARFGGEKATASEEKEILEELRRIRKRKHENQIHATIGAQLTVVGPAVRSLSTSAMLDHIASA